MGGFGSELRFAATAVDNIAVIVAAALIVRGGLGDWMLWWQQGEEG